MDAKARQRRFGRPAGVFFVAFSMALHCMAGTDAANSQTVEQFYKGKEVRVIISGAPASDYDMYARLITRLMTKYLPGNPAFIPQNMVGGGHLTATNYLYNVAAQDGSVIGGTARNIPYAALLKDPNARYDPVKFNWLGNPEVSAQICAVIAGVAVQNAEDLFEKELLIGGAGAASTPSQSALLFSRLLGMKFKLVDGYKSVPDVSLAMMRGEVHSVCQSLNALQGGNLQGWIADGRLKVLFNFEKEPIKGVKGLDAPSIYRFAKTAEQREILDFYTSGTRLGRPMLAPPNVPADRVAALRKAFIESVNDPVLREEVAKVGGEVTLVPGDEVQKIVADIMKTPVELAQRVEKMTSAK
jgi:tripartite-type tricarboxylate transporter receptor subunit TctC